MVPSRVFKRVVILVLSHLAKIANVTDYYILLFLILLMHILVYFNHRRSVADRTAEIMWHRDIYALHSVSENHIEIYSFVARVNFVDSLLILVRGGAADAADFVYLRLLFFILIQNNSSINLHAVENPLFRERSVVAITLDVRFPNLVVSNWELSDQLFYCLMITGLGLSCIERLHFVLCITPGLLSLVVLLLGFAPNNYKTHGIGN